ncbi:hypothetical protein [Streptomyces yerevanensis]|uniref:hypothetical protein n=1 Tax=Streptomyces yerevanensis TaxID=66378 RepID=UPI000AE7F55B|nr:hypothetical protein [Streptomyces yerevanensis]
MPDTRPLEIPTDFNRWHPNEMTEWLAGIEDDETITDADVDRARQAVHHALVIK